nr:MAG TPA: hypothetical protein [Caudoviricetes sp.]
MQVKYTHSLYILFEQTLYSHICIKYHRLNNPIYRLNNPIYRHFYKSHAHARKFPWA